MFVEDKKATDLLTSLAVDACREMFEAYGVQMTSLDCEQVQGRVSYCGIMGFVGPVLRGVCMLGASGGPLDESSPWQGNLRDWLGELTNQLVGRVKAKLLTRGVEIALTTPVVLKGEHIAPLPRRELNPKLLCRTNGSMLLWVEAETSPGFAVSEHGDVELPAREGDVLLF